MAAKSLCKVDGCGKIAVRRGWCYSHYKRWVRHGDPELGRTPKGDPQAFIASALQYAGDDCLIWPYSRSSYGYGQINRGGRPHHVHRIVCEAVYGPPPQPNHDTAHSCGKGHTGCVNPRHLRWASRLENQMDRVDHGTSNRGERHGMSKLSREDVLKIREYQGVLSRARIAKLFGVSVAAIRDIHMKKTWSWL